MRHLIALLLLALAAPVFAQTTKPSRPNIILIITDDQRYDCLSITGHPFLKTPNFDRIGREGAVFKNYFVTLPLCSPSRASILTGQYASRHGIIDNKDRAAQSHQLKTFPQLLQKAGYETALFGKWHMGVDPSPRPGFDHWCAMPGQGRYIDPVFNQDGQRVVKKGYITDVLTTLTTDFIENRAAKDKPFFLYLGHKAVHSQFTPAERHKDLYADQILPTPPSVFDDMKGKPALLQAEDKPLPKEHLGLAVPDSVIRDQLRCIQSVDDSTGAILKSLEKSGQLDNTVIVFTSDNGYFWNEHHLGDKRAAYEESIRCPLLIRYPKQIKAGTVREQIVLNIDLAPTFLELAGATSPEKLQGQSLVKLFSEDVAGKDFRTSALFEYFKESAYANIPTWKAVRTDRYKLITYPEFPGMEELYDLKADPAEMKNLIKEDSAKGTVEQLKMELARLRKQYEQ
ncbi:MAG TPA: sulfatase [Tepidisphaeraceae bacterium]|jgi:N-acetylglucosamine-6-sulfatase